MNASALIAVGSIFFANLFLSILFGSTYALGPSRWAAMARFSWETLPLSSICMVLIPLFTMLTKNIRTWIVIFLAIIAALVVSICYSILQIECSKGMIFSPIIVNSFSIGSIFCWIPATLISFGIGLTFFRPFKSRIKAGLMFGAAVAIVAVCFFFLIRIGPTVHVIEKPADNTSIQFTSMVNGRERTITLSRTLLDKQVKWLPDSNPPLSPLSAKHFADSIFHQTILDTSLWYLNSITLCKLDMKTGIWGYRVVYDKKTNKQIGENIPDYMDIPVLFDGSTRGLESLPLLDSEKKE